MAKRETLARHPEFEALWIMLEVPTTRNARNLARAVAKSAGAGNWRLEPVTADGSEWELLPRRRITTGRAWDVAYAVRDVPQVIHAEPMFRYQVPENADRRARRALGGGRADDPATATDFEWSLRKTNVLDAWRLFGAALPGAGVRVGHPDTGYTLHPELSDPSRLLIGDGFDFEDEDPDASDDLDDDFLENPGHGTATGSIIVSGVGPATPGTTPFVSGVAPHASLIPIRTTESVVLFSMRNLRQALDHATAHGAHVISMSLGGPFPGFGTRRAIARAIDAGAIVLAAAGNEVGFVVFPAAFDEVIAVAATNIQDRPWTGSSHGDAVDISAPGESVWRARPERDSAGKLRFAVERGNGTSFAVATTAGVAALWVSFHGWTTLSRKYTPRHIAGVFKQLLQKTCRTPRGWDANEYGPGIVDAKRLLAAPLPDAPPARKVRDASRAAVSADVTGIETLLHLLPGVSRTRLEEALVDVLQVDDRQLPKVLQDYGDELAFQLAMQPALLAALRQQTRGGKAAAAGRRQVRARLSRASMSSSLRKRLERQPKK